MEELQKLKDDLKKTQEYVFLLKAQIGDLFVTNKEQSMYIGQLEERIKELTNGLPAHIQA